MRINIEELKQNCMKALAKLGYSKENSEIIISEYMYGELCGKKSHGISAFCDFIAKKQAPAKDAFKIIKEEDNYALIDAKGNLGQIVGKSAMDLAIDKAKKKGIALVGMNNMNSYLIPGYYAKMASDKNMVGVVINNALSRVAPTGGIEPRLGTNPLAIAIPTKGNTFLLDMATAIRAMAEVRLAKKLGHKLPEGMCIDSEGNMTTEPDRFHALTTFGSYKGYGLCLAIEIMAGSFVKAKMGSRLKNGLDRGYLFLTINPEIFVDIETFKKETAKLVKEVKSCKTAKDVQEVLIPGENAARNIRRNLKNRYIDVEDILIGTLEKYCE